MAKRDSDGKLVGPISGRGQFKNPVTKRWVKIDTHTGKIIDHKKTPGKWKSVREI
jgi:hypothetical protein